jgi:hypothetical protein
MHTDERRPPDKLDVQKLGNQMVATFKFIVSLLHFRSGWRANHALQPTPVGVVRERRQF